MSVVAYKVFESKDGDPYFMFYGINGSRRVELDKTLKCVKKLVRDGTGKRWYMSGFHVYADKNVLQQFLKTLKIRKDRYVVEVQAPVITRKHERSKAHLAEEIVVTGRAWANRKPI